MLDELNKVLTVVTIDGKIVPVLHIRLEQEFNHHHKFEILLDCRVLDKKWMINPSQTLRLQGCVVTIHFTHKISGIENFFVGLLSQISFVGKRGAYNQVLLTGYSPTILLDSNITTDSFVDKSLKDIVSESIATSGNSADVKLNPLFSSDLDYFCQYQETCYEFMNRLSWLYGEWFYYDGADIIFGKPKSSETMELIYDENLVEMDFSASAQPSNFARYAYLPHESSTVSYSSKDEDVDVTGYAKQILNISSSVYASTNLLPLETPITSKSDLETLVKMEKSRAVARMLTIKGKSLTCAVGIGRKVSVRLSKSMDVPIRDIDTFWVKKVVHEVDGGGAYCNWFEGFVADMDYVPMEKVPIFIGPQLAVVTDNADDKGRVKVQMHWQQIKNKTTNWIKVVTPYGGTGSQGTRGFSFIPEIGDWVVLNFEYGDPSRPFVADSIYPENVGKGGGDGNKTKSLVSPTGIAVQLDDEKGSVTIKDKNGTDTTMVFDGNGNMTFQSKETIGFSCGKSTLAMTKEGDISINGKSIFAGGSESVDFAAGAGTGGEGGELSGVHVAPNEVSASSKGDVNIGAEKNLNMVGMEDVAVVAAKNLTTKGDAQIQIN